MRKRLAYGLALLLWIVSFGVAQGPNSSAPSKKTAGIQQAGMVKKLGLKPYQVGTASWYGSDFDGKATASGEPYNMYDLTAAHMSLPLGSLVQVTNLRNGRSVVVRVNDRGPVVPGRIIDVSYGAARVLEFKSRGLQNVRLDVVRQQTARQQTAHQQTVAELRPVAY